jgi:hypothetical protein
MTISNQSTKQDAPNWVKADPTWKTSKKNMRYMTIFALFWIGGACFTLLENARNGERILLSSIYLLLGIWYLLLPFIFRKRGEQAWKYYEQRRQLAAQGNREQVTLATEQPIPDALALPLSAVLRSKNRIYIIVLVFAVVFLLAVLISLSIEITLLFLSIIHIDIMLIVIDIAILLILLLFTILGAVFGNRQSVQQLEFTEAGLLKRTGKKVTFVPWDEARLFTIASTSPNVKKVNGPPTHYELSSSNEVLRWFASEHAGEAPTPSDRYYQQMQALLSVIAARTGLPLYDLR